MNFKSFYLDEMAKPTDEHRGLWYHGTNKDGYEGIKTEGYLIPRKDVTEKTRKAMSPVHNKVYMTSDVGEAINYAFFRSKPEELPDGIKNYGTPIKFGYLVIIDGKELNDLDPDEDILADLIPKYVKEYNNSWLRNLALTKAPKALDKYDRHGDYAYGTALGKLLIKYLTDEQKYELIRYGKKIAHTGQVKVKEIWKLSQEKYRQQYNKQDYKNFGTLIWSAE